MNLEQKLKQRFHASLVALGILSLLTVFVLLIWLLPEHVNTTNLPESEIAKLKMSVRTLVVQGFGGLVLLGTLIYSMGRVVAMERANQIAQDGNVTDRFAKAVELMGEDKSVAERIGGIYALERISRESKYDWLPVFNIIVAYINSKCERTRLREEQLHLTEDVHASLSVITSILTNHYHLFENRINASIKFKTIELKDCELLNSVNEKYKVNLDFFGNRFFGVNVKMENLASFASEGNEYDRCIFNYYYKPNDAITATFHKDTLDDCSFVNVKINSTLRFNRCTIRNTSLIDCAFSEGIFSYSSFEGDTIVSSFEKVTFKNVTFKDVDFAGSKYTNCTFEKCKFINCDFYTSDFSTSHFDSDVEFYNPMNYLDALPSGTTTIEESDQDQPTTD